MATHDITIITVTMATTRTAAVVPTTAPATTSVKSLLVDYNRQPITISLVFLLWYEHLGKVRGHDQI